MIPHLFYYQLVILGLLWLCVMLHLPWPSRAAVSPQKPVEPEPIKPKRKHAIESKPFAGLPQKPPCALGAHEAAPPTPSSPVRPAPMPPTNRRPREVETSRQCCPHANWDARGWVGLGNLRANGPPSGGQWRQCHCRACQGSLPEPHGPLGHGKRVSVDRIVHVRGCPAEGVGSRGTARVCEVAPNTVLQWVMAAAEHLRALASSFLHDLPLTQGQLDALSAVLRALKAGTVSEAGAIERLSRSPQWLWAALDPESTCLLTIDVGKRRVAMAQRVLPQGVQVLAPDCAPRFLTDGFRESMTALLPHYGHGRQPPRRQGPGPLPKPRGMPLPQLL
jgi:hypothetical protein